MFSNISMDEVANRTLGNIDALFVWDVNPDCPGFVYLQITGISISYIITIEKIKVMIRKHLG